MVEFIVSFLFVIGLIIAAGAVETSVLTTLAGLALMALAALIAYVAEKLGYQFKS